MEIRRGQGGTAFDVLGHQPDTSTAMIGSPPHRNAGELRALQRVPAPRGGRLEGMRAVSPRKATQGQAESRGADGGLTHLGVHRHVKPSLDKKLRQRRAMLERCFADCVDSIGAERFDVLRRRFANQLHLAQARACEFERSRGLRERKDGGNHSAVPPEHRRAGQRCRTSRSVAKPSSV